ncbi:MAG: A/G-specific adenine glycosylase [Halobacteriovorax sp.]|nr:A/G-specific adenine glycosylase [Halobacteriovorax sp.]
MSKNTVSKYSLPMDFTKLMSWSLKEFSSLPWRKERTLYGTLVSEIMLQQTTVSTVRGKFEEFLARFPTLKDLAAASEDEVCMAWKGLGYYRRARNLRKAAQSLIGSCNGKFPVTQEELVKLPGIGDYTASALIAIGMDKSELAIDANIERVMARYFGLGQTKGPKLHREIREMFLTGDIFPEEISARGFNEAIMDVGRVYCQAKKANCLNCPLAEGCIALLSGEPLAFPNTDQVLAKTPMHKVVLIRVISKEGNQILGVKRKRDEWLAGQVELPTYILESSDPSFKRYPLWKGPLPLELMRLGSTITKYKFENIIVESSVDLGKKWKLSPEEVNFSSVTLKILRQLKLV